MNHLPFHTAHHWITQLTQLPHPITINHIPPLAQKLNWEPSEVPEIYIYLNKPRPSKILISFSRKTGEVFELSFPLAFCRPPSLKCGIQTADLYLQYIADARKAWGEPFNYETNPTDTTWKLTENAYIEFTLHSDKILISYRKNDISQFSQPVT